MDVHGATNAQVALLAAVEAFRDSRYSTGGNISDMADFFLTWLDSKS